MRKHQKLHSLTSLSELLQCRISSSQAVDGFLLVVNTEGVVKFVTENITQYINYTKDDVLGKDIYNIIHHGDHNTFMPSLLPMSSLGMYLNSITHTRVRHILFPQEMDTRRVDCR